MPEKGGNSLSFVIGLGDNFHVTHLKMLLHFLWCHGEEFQRFHEIIAEPMVKFPLNFTQFLLRFLRKRRRKVASHYLFSVAYQPI